MPSDNKNDVPDIDVPDINKNAGAWLKTAEELHTKLYNKDGGLKTRKELEEIIDYETQIKELFAKVPPEFETTFKILYLLCDTPKIKSILNAHDDPLKATNEHINNIPLLIQGGKPLLHKQTRNRKKRLRTTRKHIKGGGDRRAYDRYKESGGPPMSEEEFNKMNRQKTPLEWLGMAFTLVFFWAIFNSISGLTQKFTQTGN